jgi:hypothetical protein
MTSIGKFLVLANLFLSVTLLSWAVSLFANQVPWLNRTTSDGQTIQGKLTQLQEEISGISKTISETSQIYGRRWDDLLAQEAYRRRRNEFYQDHLNRARRGDPVGGGVFREFQLVGGIGPLINIGEPGTVVNDTNERPLRGLKDIQDELDRSLADAATHRQKIRQFRTDHEKTSAEIRDLDLRIQAEHTIFKNLQDEEKYLSSLQVNWDQELRVLLIRKGQLERQLKLYEQSTE